MNERYALDRLVLASSSPRRRELVAALRLPLPVEVLATDTDETVEPGLEPHEIVTELSLRKAAAAAQRLSAADLQEGRSALVLGGDTIVVLDGEVLGKPADAADACRTLRRLSGRAHEVYSGVSLLRTGMREFRGAADSEQPFPASELAVPAFGEAVDASSASGRSSGGLRWSSEARLGRIGRWRIAEASPDEPVCAVGYTRSEVIFRELSEAEIEAYVASGDPLDKAGSYGVQGLGSVLIEEIAGDFYSVMGLPLALVYQMLLPFGVSPLRS
ncbi:Maf family protein [Paenibacillus pasadenensis]|uniref:Maf family protein n=1 Tax=Paenibacillus pasadenensis TaxID=217090 RepID=UPI00203DAA17|nr:Maf family protein [Paenibacillus pasadenensis]MCM3746717.1 Maf family protein [Paenibacillus pasadenensis]